VTKQTECGEKKDDMCQEFPLVNFTVQTIWKSRDKTVSVLKKIDHKLNDHRSQNGATWTKQLLKWFKQKRSENEPVRNPLLMAMAEELAKLLNSTELVCITGCTDRFKLCHVSCGKVSCETTAEWLKKFWPKVRACYSKSDNFNADETSTFFRLIQDKTPKFK
jgi:hypothetical protein